MVYMMGRKKSQMKEIYNVNIQMLNIQYTRLTPNFIQTDFQ